AIDLCKTMGLQFFCATDHSYDLDDRVDNYLVHDPNLPKWKALQREVDTVNGRERNFCVIRGEEVSCRNADQRNIHLLLLGNREFIPGSGDGAERWLNTRSEHSLSEVLRFKAPDTAAFAAHPKDRVPFLQRVLIGRGEWSTADLAADGLTGIQFANGVRGRAFDHGYTEWVRLLLAGRRTTIAAGNDAHGNFNRFRQVSIPFIRTREMDAQKFGEMRTGVFAEGPSHEQGIVLALHQGRSIITDGPVCTLRLTGANGEEFAIGDVARGSMFQGLLEIFSSEDFGEIAQATIVHGVVGERKETVLHQALGSQGFSLVLRFPFESAANGYVRATVRTSTMSFDGLSHFCMTNPIWVET
ncbi:MAG: hypothetical protein WD295_04835, partial [Bacteroidota bacterium]